MSLEGQFSFLCRNSYSIVCYTDVALSPLANFHGNPVGTAVNRVFYKFFYNRKRFFNNLSCCNLVGYKWVKFLYHFNLLK